MPKASESILQSMAVNQKPTAQFVAKQLSSGQITVPQPLFPFLG
jgi:hypothetical protein